MCDWMTLEDTNDLKSMDAEGEPRGEVLMAAVSDTGIGIVVLNKGGSTK